MRRMSKCGGGFLNFKEFRDDECVEEAHELNCIWRRRRYVFLVSSSCDLHDESLFVSVALYPA
jgi:hypothetical protein